jgi:Rrf2 family protein
MFIELDNDVQFGEPMTAFFSKSCEYAVQAILFIARENKSRSVQLKDIAMELQIPLTFLSKILQKLTRAEILISHKGNQGGFQLAAPARSIMLGDIVAAVDGVEFLNECVIGFSECSDARPCSLHGEWVPVRAAISRMLSERNVADLSTGIGTKIESLSPGYLQRRLIKDGQSLRS